MREFKPREHIIDQLQRSKTSMTGGHDIIFTNNTKHFVSGISASVILNKYSGMKPIEKENFQSRIGYSLENLKQELKGE